VALLCEARRDCSEEGSKLFEDFSTDQTEKVTVLSEEEETFRLFYKVVEEIFTLEGVEESARQAADVATTNSQNEIREWRAGSRKGMRTRSLG